MHACEQSRLDMPTPLRLELIRLLKLTVELPEVRCTAMWVVNRVDDVKDTHKAGVDHGIVGGVNLRHHSHRCEPSQNENLFI